MTIRPASRQPIPESARLVFHGQLFDVYQWDQPQFDGSNRVFEKLKRPDTAYVIPVTDDCRLILAEQRQPGGTPYVGLVGGRIEPSETPEQGAARELLEETGLMADHMILWDSYQFLPKIDWAIFTYIAKGCRHIREQALDSGENITLISVTFDEFLDLVRKDSFGDVEVALRILRLSSDPARLKEAKEALFG
jgi:8-oxo-dGTP pyrophosphatase MutT (NUDIX family)